MQNISTKGGLKDLSEPLPGEALLGQQVGDHPPNPACPRQNCCLRPHNMRALEFNRPSKDQELHLLRLDQDFARFCTKLTQASRLMIDVCIAYSATSLLRWGLKCLQRGPGSQMRGNKTSRPSCLPPILINPGHLQPPPNTHLKPPWWWRPPPAGAQWPAWARGAPRAPSPGPRRPKSCCRAR